MNPRITTAEMQAIKTRWIEPHRLAWGVLLVSFAIFCVLAAAAIIGIDYFLFQSTIPIYATLSLGRGTVGVMEPANPIEQIGRNGTLLTSGMVVGTDPQSQGTIRFYDPQADNHLIATITLHNNSGLTLREASRPRFEWSRARHILDLTRVTGKLSVDIFDMTGRELFISIATQAGAIVNLEGEGSYIVNAAPDLLSLVNRSGIATLIPPDLKQGHSVPVDGLGIVRYTDNSVEQRPGFVDLLADSDFSILRASGDGSTVPVWVCGNDPGDNPAGLYEFIPIEGELPLRFLRANNATNHGRTSCVQSFGQAGADILTNGYNYLSLRATFFIEYQSLNACGTDGSECPLMLRMDYLDANGDAQRWFHGFYAREAGDQDNYPLRCSTCLQDHDLINEKAWYTYESPNLLNLLTPVNADGTMGLPPRSIVGVWFYASGHQYDVRLKEVALLATKQEPSEAAQPATTPSDS